MSQKPHLPEIALAIGVLGTAMFTILAKWPGLPFSIKPTDVMNVLAPLLLAAAFIERSVEVIISPWRDPVANALIHRLQAAKTANPLSTTEIEAANEALDQYKGTTQQYAFLVSLTLGLAAAFVGIRALWPFLDTTKLASASSAQAKCFNVVDVVISATLLAGGADGIHSVVNAFTSFFNASAQKAQQSTST